MDQPTFWQGVAENWLLIGMGTAYAGAIAWAFRPGARKVHDDISQIPFRNETIAPASAPNPTEAK